MKLSEIKQEVLKYQYMDDTSVIDASIASIIANSMQLGNRTWFLIIGASSGGKSQLLRPLSLTNPLYIHRVDDITENTFLSGMKAKDKETSPSLLHQIGTSGIIVISDLTVIMSKNSESRNAILSQFRMIYDGEMIKHVGNNPEPVKWSGYLGMLAGSTPSVYAHFEEVADMGERFIYYRMKEFDQEKATRLALSRTIFDKELDNKLADLYQEYIKAVVTVNKEDIVISEEMNNRIIEVSMFAEKVRTSSSKNWRGDINRIPVSAMPMRVALQLSAIAKGLCAMRLYEKGVCEFEQSDYEIIDWIGYSLSNEENRAVLRNLAIVGNGVSMTTNDMSNRIGLNEDITRTILQNLSAVGILENNDPMGEKGSWSFKSDNYYKLVSRIEHLVLEQVIEIDF